MAQKTREGDRENGGGAVTVPVQPHGDLFNGLTDDQLDTHPDNGKTGIWRVDGVRHSCLISGVSTAREARDKAIAAEAVHERELSTISFVGELPEVFRI